ncbi:GMC oxidoreductase, partial [Sphaerobolus stellatus SS14]
DRAAAHAGIRLGLRIKEEMANEGYPIKDYLVPKSLDPVDLNTFIDAWGQSIYHYTSSCRMAPEDDTTPGLVDDELKVHGVNRLRIADASIFLSILCKSQP